MYIFLINLVCTDLAFTEKLSCICAPASSLFSIFVIFPSSVCSYLYNVLSLTEIPRSVAGKPTRFGEGSKWQERRTELSAILWGRMQTVQKPFDLGNIAGEFWETPLWCHWDVNGSERAPHNFLGTCAFSREKYMFGQVPAIFFVRCAIQIYHETRPLTFHCM